MVHGMEEVRGSIPPQLHEMSPRQRLCVSLAWGRWPFLAPFGGELKDQFGLALGAIVTAITATIAVAWFIGWYLLAAATATIALVVSDQI